MGMFPIGSVIHQREFINLTECTSWCDDEPRCKAVVASPAYWAYRECFLITTDRITTKAAWKTALKSCWSRGNDLKYFEVQ